MRARASGIRKRTLGSTLEVTTGVAGNADRRERTSRALKESRRRRGITTPVVKGGLALDEILGRCILMHHVEDELDPERPTDGTASIRIARGILPK